MGILDLTDWRAVRQHYNERLRVHREAVKLYEQRSISKFANVVLGITEAHGNYSAAEHGLGPKILALNINGEDRVFNLAGELKELDNARPVPHVIRRAGLKYLQVGVGSEISCIMSPTTCWVANTRTIWTHLVIKHNDSIVKADEELRLYREADVTSEMAYHMWADIHTALDVALTRIGTSGQELSVKAGVTPGRVTFLWADAIASYLYDMHHG